MCDVFFYRHRRAWSRDVQSRDACLSRDGANNKLDQIFAAPSIDTEEATSDTQTHVCVVVDIL